MSKGYWLIHVSVNDSDNYPRYVEASAPVYKKWGAKLIVRGGQHEIVEGNSGNRHVVIEFESYEKALAAYRSPEYQAAAKLRQTYGEADFVIIEGA